MTKDDDHLEYNKIFFDSLYRYDDATNTCELVAINGVAVRQIHKGDFLFPSKYVTALEESDEIRRRNNKAKADREAAKALELDMQGGQV